MEEPEQSRSKSLEGQRIFEGIRPDNQEKEMDPKKFRDGVPNFTENAEDKDDKSALNEKTIHSAEKDKVESTPKETNLENNDQQPESPLNTNIYGDKPQAEN